jgi:hypothetical protein
LNPDLPGNVELIGMVQLDVSILSEVIRPKNEPQPPRSFFLAATVL